MPVTYRLERSLTGTLRYSTLDFCHECGSKHIACVPAGANGKAEDRSDRATWRCFECDAKVLSDSSGYPLGYMASLSVRKMRHTYHRYLTYLTEMGCVQNQVIEYVAKEMHIDREYFHGAWLTFGELVIAINIMKKIRPHKIRERKKTQKKPIARNTKRTKIKTYQW